jgi:hypothetical protein
MKGGIRVGTRTKSYGLASGQWRARRHGVAGIYGNPDIVEAVTYRFQKRHKSPDPTLSAIIKSPHVGISCVDSTRLEFGRRLRRSIIEAHKTTTRLANQPTETRRRRVPLATVATRIRRAGNRCKVAFSEISVGVV